MVHKTNIKHPVSNHTVVKTCKRVKSLYILYHLCLSIRFGNSQEQVIVTPSQCNTCYAESAELQ